MTTILADRRLGVMVSDSNVSDGDRVWTRRKVWKIRSHLIGIAGNTDEVEAFLGWWRDGCAEKQPKFDNSEALVLSVGGLLHYNGSRVPETIKEGIESIGTGAKAAMCAYEALQWRNPAAAVRLVCKHDAGSRKPVRIYNL